jgi:hypothetical protein
MAGGASDYSTLKRWTKALLDAGIKNLQFERSAALGISNEGKLSNNFIQSDNVKSTSERRILLSEWYQSLQKSDGLMNEIATALLPPCDIGCAIEKIGRAAVELYPHSEFEN